MEKMSKKKNIVPEWRRKGFNSRLEYENWERELGALSSSRPVKSFHPGETLDEKLQELGMSVEDFSAKAGLSAWVVKSFIGGDMSVTADMALAFEQVTHIPAHYWLNAQRNYDEYLLIIK